jgi:hypothetical protein
MRRLKGQGWQADMAMKAIAIFIVFGVSILLILAATGGFSNVLNEFCENYPTWCGKPGPRTEEYYKVTLKSTEALVCAIKAAINNDDTCINSFTRPANQDSGNGHDGSGHDSIYDPFQDPTIYSGNIASDDYLDFITTLAIGVEEEDFGDPYITCNFKDNDDDIPEIKPESSWWQRQWWRIKSLFIDSKSIKYGCTVHNYHAPQDLETIDVLGTEFSPEKWIAGFGDPRFLVYFQSFPDGEASYWSGYSTALDNVAAVVLFAFPAEKFLQGGKWLIKKGTYSIGEKLGITKLGDKGKKLLDKFFSTSKLNPENTRVMMMGKSLSKEAREEAIEGYYSKYILDHHGKPFQVTATKPIQQVTETEGNSFIKKVLMAGSDQKGMTMADFRALARITGKSTFVALLAAFADSRNEKYLAHEGQVVLKSPYEPAEDVGFVDNVWQEKTNPLPGQLETIEVGHPIILDKQLGFMQDPLSGLGIRPSFTEFYLASPCHADIFVEFGTGDNVVFCENYVYDPETRSVDCKFIERREACNKAILAENLKVNIDDQDLLDFLKGSPCNHDDTYFNYIPQCGMDNTAQTNWVVGAVLGNRNTYCRINSVKITIDKSKYGNDDNFCYGKPSSLKGPIFIAALVIDIILKEFGVGFVPQVSIGIIGGAAYVAESVRENWP